MNKQSLTDDEADALLFASLSEETDEVPEAVASALHKELYRKRKGWGLTWWIPALIGVLQTAAAVAVILLLFPGSILGIAAAAAGAGASVCACLLWGFSRKTWKEELEC